MSDMDFEKIKNLVKRNGEKLILVENGEPEAVVMSFDEYTRLMGTGAVMNRANAASAGVAPVPMHLSAVSSRNRNSGEVGHATEERFDMPLPNDREEHYEPEFYGESESMFFDESLKPPAHDVSVRLADIRLEDLPI